MGYTTKFEGTLTFTTEATASQLAALNAMMGEDCRDHKEWNAPDLTYIDLELAPDFSGLTWSGAEKTYDLEKLVNVVIRVMRERWPEFGLTGSMMAQGEDCDDRWMLVIGEDGWATKAKIALTGTVVDCPECGHRFVLAKEAKP